ncbi:hypothetical protein VFPPC_16607 [Pochonia chlamydosporia 170]|uniref:Uncharacterized protein n=1 Tax=Pochonia chlamydosporia 170 TaxID=1380566 RepID=A0A179F9H7_METCM|nr:hypothetical protein VFPPC_16607 [Pochonia chlamydosporia 170]OAQ62102.1 hypothetical protein VFPPC_16607 [Pochonia chlamydosporia 170]
MQRTAEITQYSRSSHLLMSQDANWEATKRQIAAVGCDGSNRWTKHQHKARNFATVEARASYGKSELPVSHQCGELSSLGVAACLTHCFRFDHAPGSRQLE